MWVPERSSGLESGSRRGTILAAAATWNGDSSSSSSIDLGDAAFRWIEVTPRGLEFRSVKSSDVLDPALNINKMIFNLRLHFISPFPGLM